MTEPKPGGRFGITTSDARGIVYCLKVFLGLRVAVTLIALAGVALIPMNDVTEVPGWPAPPAERGFSNAATSLERWDALWFLRIADQGYDEDDASAAFFPLYPLVSKAFGWILGGHPLAGALVVSNVGALAALLVVYRLTRLEYDDDTALAAVLFMAVFPTSFFLLAPYSESLFLALAGGAVLCAREKRWAAAGALGAAAAATRSIGIVLIAALMAEAVHQHREAREAAVDAEQRPPASGLVVRLVAALLPATGTLAYLAYWHVTAGDALAPFGEQANWLRELTFPISTLIDGTTAAFEFVGVGVGGYALLDWFVVVPVTAGVLWAAVRARPVHGIYAALSLLIPLMFVFEARPFMSLPRFALVVWPVFWAFARFAQTRRMPELYASGSALGLGVFLLLYVNWYWIF